MSENPGSSDTNSHRQPEKTQGAPESKSDDYITLPFSRRTFLKATGLGAASVALGALARKVGILDPFLGKPQETNPTNLLEGITNPEAKNGTIVLGQTETSLQKEMLGFLSWVPDGPITYYTTAEGTRRYLLTGGKGNATYMLETDGKRTLKDVMASGEINQNSFKEVYGPDENVEYRRFYAGITSVLQIDKSNLDHLLGVTHCEDRASRNESGTFKATIGLAESFDGGLTWQDKGPLIEGDDPQTPGKDVSGAGQPTAIYNEKGGYVYILYVDWARVNFHHPDQVYLARAKVNDNGTLEQTEYWTTDNKFDTNFDASKMKAAIPVPQDDSGILYTALPSVSWNTDLNQYVCTGECDKGFWLAKSQDLINWSTPEIIYDFTQRGGKPHSILQPGEKWDSYPTLLDESQPNSKITGKNGIFYHSSGDNLTPHEPAALDYSITN